MGKEAADSRWGAIPDGVLLALFSFLNARDLTRASLVSRHWKRVAQDPTLWFR